MIQDYAKKSTNKTPQKRGFLLVSIVVCFAILVPLIFFFVHFYKIKQHNASIKKPITKTSQMTTSRGNIQTQKPHPEFDFYTLLPKIEVPTATIPVLSQNASNQNQYVLQIASLPNVAQAKSLIARLDKLGFRTFIQKHESPTQSWFRIMTGPYESWENAEQAQKNLQDQHIDSILIKIKKAPA